MVKRSLVLVAALAIVTPALGAGENWIFWDIGNDPSVGTTASISGAGMSSDGVALSYNSGGKSYIYSKASGAFAINTAGNNVGIAKVGNEYAIAYNLTSGFSKAYTWKGGLDGVGTTTGDPFSSSTSSYFYARGIAGDSTQAYVGGSKTTSVTVASRWKAPAGSVADYGQPSNFSNTNYYLYSASNIGTYAGWGRLSAAGTVTNKSQAMVLDGSLVSLRNPWGAPSTSYYSNAYIAGDGQTVFGYSGLSDNTTAQACYWNRSEYGTFTTNTTANWIPFLDGYTKSYAMKGDGNVIAGYTVKPAGTWGVDRRTIFLYDKSTGTLQDLRTVLANKGVDLSAWGLMDITGISADGTKLSGTMLASTDTYWTTGTVNTPYHTWMIDLNGTIVPEPATVAFLAIGGLLMARRRRSR